MDFSIYDHFLQGNYYHRIRHFTRSTHRTCLVARNTCLTTFDTRSTCLSAFSTRLSICSNSLSISLSIRSIRLSTRSIYMSSRSSRGTICRSFYNSYISSILV